MTTNITISVSEEDAKRLEEAFRSGKLDSLGIMSFHRQVGEHEDKSWVEIERQRENEKPGQDGRTRK